MDHMRPTRTAQSAPRATRAGDAAPEALAGAIRWRPIAALVLLTLVWGVSVPMMKLGLRDISPFGLVALRYACAAPFFAVLLLGRRRPPARALAAMAAIAALGLGVGQVLQVIGVQRTSAAVATIITAAIPIFTVLLAVLRLRQRVQPHHLAGLAVALGGIALASISAQSGESGFTARAASGDALMVVSSVCIAAYYVLSAEVALRHGVMIVAAWSTVFGAVLLSPLAVWALAHGDAVWTPRAVGVIAYLGLLVTVLGIWIWLSALRDLPVRVAASSQYVQPLVGIAASAAIFVTPLGAGFFFGTALVLVGIGLTALSRPARRGTR